MASTKTLLDCCCTVVHYNDGSAPDEVWFCPLHEYAEALLEAAGRVLAESVLCGEHWQISRDARRALESAFALCEEKAPLPGL